MNSVTLAPQHMALLVFGVVLATMMISYVLRGLKAEKTEAEAEIPEESTEEAAPTEEAPKRYIDQFSRATQEGAWKAFVEFTSTWAEGFMIEGAEQPDRGQMIGFAP